MSQDTAIPGYTAFIPDKGNGLHVSFRQALGDVNNLSHLRPVIERNDAVSTLFNHLLPDKDLPQINNLHAESLRQTISGLGRATSGNTAGAMDNADLSAYIRKEIPQYMPIAMANAGRPPFTSREKSLAEEGGLGLSGWAGGAAGVGLGAWLASRLNEPVTSGDGLAERKSKRRNNALRLALGSMLGGGVGMFVGAKTPGWIQSLNTASNSMTGVKSSSVNGEPDDARKSQRMTRLRNILLGALGLTAGGVAMHRFGNKAFSPGDSKVFDDAVALGGQIRTADSALIQDPARAGSHRLFMDYIDRLSPAARVKLFGKPVISALMGPVRQNVIDPMLPESFRMKDTLIANPKTYADRLHNLKTDNHNDHYRAFEEGPIRAYAHQLEKGVYDKDMDYSTLKMLGVPTGFKTIYPRVAQHLAAQVEQATGRKMDVTSPDWENPKVYQAALGKAVSHLNHGQQMDIINGTSQFIKDRDPLFWKASYDPAIRAMSEKQTAPPEMYASYGNALRTMLNKTPLVLGAGLALGGLGLGAYGLYHAFAKDEDEVSDLAEDEPKVPATPAAVP